jgi:uncharacterized protein (TIGR02284 family)
MENEKTIDVLNTLVKINNDRTEGYETALKETNESDLKALFAEFARTSQKNNNELSDAIFKLGGTPTANTTIAGAFFRTWMDLKAALTSKDRKYILNSCEFGEDKALEVYASAMNGDSKFLPSEIQEIVIAQNHLIKADHDRVKTLRDAC